MSCCKIKRKYKYRFFTEIPKTKLNIEECDSVGKQIKYYREKKGLTQKKLAEQINMTKRIVADAERYDYITLNNIHKIEEVLDIRGKIILDEYYCFLVDKPIEKLFLLLFLNNRTIDFL